MLSNKKIIKIFYDKSWYETDKQFGYVHNIPTNYYLKLLKVSMKKFIKFLR